MITRKEIIEGYFRIINKKKELVDFQQNFVQNKLDEIRDKLKREGKPIWLLVLKARQEGISVKVMADWTADCVSEDNIVATLVSHEGEATKRLFRKAKINVDKAKVPIQTRTDNSREIEFPKTGSWFYILTAGSRAGGRGDTIHRLHLSEVAHYKDQTILVGLLQAIPENGEIIAETTGNGFGEWFQKEWDKAEKGESKFTPVFFSWADNPEYRIVNTILTPEDLTEEEKILMDSFRLDIQQIAWRREKMKEFTTRELFYQEYPLTPEEAFIHSGTPAFNMMALKTYKRVPPRIGMFVDKGDVVVFEPNENGWWRVWESSEPGQGYYGFLDPAEGKDASDDKTGKDPDYSAIEFYDQNLIQVAELQRRITPAESGRQLVLAARYYNQAYIGWELNNAGHAVSVVVLEIYTKSRCYQSENNEYGWRTTEKTRKVLIDGFSEMIPEHDIEIKSQWSISEAQSFVLNGDGKYEAHKGAHDDTVIANSGVIQLWKNKPIKTMSAVKKALREEKKKQKKFNPYYET